MAYSTFAINFFVALFALIDPVGNVAVFAAVTPGATGKDRAQLSALISAVVFAFLAFFYFTGIGLLAFFGISLPAFRIAGGVILFMLGLQMASGRYASSFAAEAESAPGDPAHYVRARFERMIVPFAMPLLIGPGAISTAIIYANEARRFGFAGALIGVGVMAAMALSCFFSFLATPVITRLLGKLGLTIVVRVLGLILCALAVQFLLAGLADSTTGLIRPSAAQPYGQTMGLPQK